jgi:hypothetical protein
LEPLDFRDLATGAKSGAKTANKILAMFLRNEYNR